MKGPRPKNQGLVGLRRSGDRQETSLEKQLQWALHAAQQRGVRVDATQADLEYMQANRLHAYKSLRLDDAITGGDLERPGLTALIRDAIGDPRVSHIFAFKRDRLGRLDHAVEMVSREVQLLQRGITLIFSDTEVHPKPGGGSDIGEQVKTLIDYHASGQLRRDLAEQMINTQLLLARDGYSTGGTPPYGFVRALVDGRGNILEILAKGKRVRQLDCSVVWIPDSEDDTKLRTWIHMLSLKEAGWGYKRIANHLNFELKIPSPAAGSTRTDHGVKHKVSGLWTAGSVKALLENRTIVAIFDYGRRSEGKVRRLGDQEPRFLDEADYNDQKKPKTVLNHPSRVLRIARPFQPLFDPQRWEGIREATRARGSSQVGIPRARNPAKYPLSCRVIDLTDACGSIMYARTSGNRPVYQCGQYMNSGGKGCHNNQVDAEALLKFVLGTLRELTGRFADREALRDKLMDRARQEQEEPRVDGEALQRTQLQAQIEHLEQGLGKAQRNLALEEEPDLREAIRNEYRRLKQELAEAQQKLSASGPSATTTTTVEEEVDQALSLLERIEQIASDPEARAQVPQVLRELNLWVGLNFVEGIKGKKRRVRRLAGGVVAFGEMPLRGATEAPPSVEAQDQADHGTCAVANEKADRVVRSASSRREGISFTKVNRGDRI